MGMMLEVEKRDGKIVDYKFQGMALAWGIDPNTGIRLRYTCDWVVIESLEPLVIKIIECKGHGRHAISAEAKLRFKGCRAEWPMFKFELHQRDKDGAWNRLL